MTGLLLAALLVAGCGAQNTGASAPQAGSPAVQEELQLIESEAAATEEELQLVEPEAAATEEELQLTEPETTAAEEELQLAEPETAETEEELQLIEPETAGEEEHPETRPEAAESEPEQPESQSEASETEKEQLQAAASETEANVKAGKEQQEEKQAAETVSADKESKKKPEQEKPAIDEDGVYTKKDDVALYIRTYGKLPQNFITKKKAQELGWPGGSLEPYAPGKCIGGDHFGNYEGALPKGKKIKYRECDIDTLGRRSRGAKRIIYSNDGKIYYTDDHYETFTLLYDDGKNRW